MGLLSNLFQQQQQIAQNPASVVRTPQQQAYDNLLNRQYDIEQQNKKYNTFNGIMQGAGGLGKILASAFVKDPMQQYGAMQGLGEQETRTDNLRQAYDNVRMAQNKDYVQQAKEQLDLANADDERKYNRELTANQIAYKKAMDLLEQQNKDRQFEFAKEQWEKEFGLKGDQFKYAQNKDTRDFKYATEKDDRNYKEGVRQFDISTGLKQDEMTQKKLEAEEKLKQEKINKALALVDSFNSAGSIEPKDYLELRELAKNYPDDFMEYVKDSGNYKESGLLLGFLPWKTAGNKNKFTVKNSIANKDTSGL